jgi:hypothetical protein
VLCSCFLASAGEAMDAPEVGDGDANPTDLPRNARKLQDRPKMELAVQLHNDRPLFFIGQMVVAAGWTLLESYLHILSIDNAEDRITYMADVASSKIWNAEVSQIMMNASCPAVLRRLDLAIVDMHENEWVISPQLQRAQTFMDLLISTAAAHAWSGKHVSTLVSLHSQKHAARNCLVCLYLEFRFTDICWLATLS